MEMTPLALTSAAAATQLPVGRQLHQVQCLPKTVLTLMVSNRTSCCMPDTVTSIGTVKLFSIVPLLLMLCAQIILAGHTHAVAAQKCAVLCCAVPYCTVMSCSFLCCIAGPPGNLLSLFQGS